MVHQFRTSWDVQRRDNGGVCISHGVIPCVLTTLSIVLVSDATLRSAMNGRFEQLDRQQNDSASTSTPSRLKRTFSDCFGCCVSKQDADGDSHLQPLNMFEPRTQNTLEDLLDRTAAARKDTWQEIGTQEPLVLNDTVNPALMGGPKWPALRQAFRIIRRRTGNIILASDGLSDPFDDITLGWSRAKHTLDTTAQMPSHRLIELAHLPNRRG